MKKVNKLKSVSKLSFAHLKQKSI